MSGRPANYAKLTREQIVLLENLFEKGMKSTTCSEMTYEMLQLFVYKYTGE